MELPWWPATIQGREIVPAAGVSAKEAAEGKYQYLVTDYPGTIGLRFNRLNNGPSAACCRRRINFLSRKRLLFYV